MFKFKADDTAIVQYNYYAPGTKWPDPAKVRMGTMGKVVSSTKKTVTIRVEALGDEPGYEVTMPRTVGKRVLVVPPIDFSHLAMRDCRYDPWNISTFSGERDTVIDR